MARISEEQRVSMVWYHFNTIRYWWLRSSDQILILPLLFWYAFDFWLQPRFYIIVGTYISGSLILQPLQARLSGSDPYIVYDDCWSIGSLTQMLSLVWWMESDPGALGMGILYPSEGIYSRFTFGWYPSEAVTEGRGLHPSSGVSQSTRNSGMWWCWLYGSKFSWLMRRWLPLLKNFSQL